MPTTNNLVDISHWEGDIDFTAVAAAGIVAVVAKATNGASGLDMNYVNNRNGALAAGLQFGSFHFGTGDNVQDQVNNYIKNAANNASELVCLDFEPNPYGPSMSLAQARDFISLFNSLTGRYPVLYSGHVIKEALGSNPDSLLANCPLWIAQYTTAPTPTWPPNWSNYLFWQYTDGSDQPPVQGIGRCDRNRYNDTDAQMVALWPF